MEFAGSDNGAYSDPVNRQPSPRANSRKGRSLAGLVLALLRVYRGVSQKALAQRVGMHHMTISQYERGRRSLAEADRQRLLDGLELPEDAWEAVESVVDWLDWLAERYETGAEERRASGCADPIQRTGARRDLSDLVARRREADRLAEAAGRERQRQVAEMLDFLIALSS